MSNNRPPVSEQKKTARRNALCLVLEFAFWVVILMLITEDMEQGGFWRQFLGILSAAAFGVAWAPEFYVTVRTMKEKNPVLYRGTWLMGAAFLLQIVCRLLFRFVWTDVRFPVRSLAALASAVVIFAVDSRERYEKYNRLRAAEQAKAG